MFRISIVETLWLIVLAAINFAVLRYFQQFLTGAEDPIVLLVGLMPLFDAFLISGYAAVTRRFRFVLVARERGRDFAGHFALTTGVTLALCTFLCFAAPSHISDLLSSSLSAYFKWLDALPTPGTRGSLVGGSLGLLMSGPLIVIAAVFSFAMSRYRRIITRVSPDSR